MGCDIHLHTEVKVNGKWEHWGNPHIDRNYRLFGRMAGVRDHEEDAISLPKGLPSDITLLTRMDMERFRDDGHSYSWLSADEIENKLYPWFVNQRNEEKRGSMYYWLETHFGFLMGNGWNMDNAKECGFEDFRFVFWFDN